MFGNTSEEEAGDANQFDGMPCKDLVEETWKTFSEVYKSAVKRLLGQGRGRTRSG